MKKIKTVRIIQRHSRKYLIIDEEKAIPIKEYHFKSPAKGSTELMVTILCGSSKNEMSASL